MKIQHGISIAIFACLFLLSGCGDEPPPVAPMPLMPKPKPVKIANVEIPDGEREFVLGQVVPIFIAVEDVDPNCQIGISILDENKGNCPDWFVCTMRPYSQLESANKGKLFKWKVAVPVTGTHYYFHWRIFPSANSFAVPSQPVGWGNPVANGISERFFVKQPKMTLSTP
jgi:hypothetical protein